MRRTYIIRFTPHTDASPSCKERIAPVSHHKLKVSDWLQSTPACHHKPARISAPETRKYAEMSATKFVGNWRKRADTMATGKPFSDVVMPKNPPSRPVTGQTRRPAASRSPSCFVRVLRHHR